MSNLDNLNGQGNADYKVYQSPNHAIPSLNVPQYPYRYYDQQGQQGQGGQQPGQVQPGQGQQQQQPGQQQQQGQPGQPSQQGIPMQAPGQIPQIQPSQQNQQNPVPGQVPHQPGQGGVPQIQQIPGQMPMVGGYQYYNSNYPYYYHTYGYFNNRPPNQGGQGQPPQQQPNQPNQQQQQQQQPQPQQTPQPQPTQSQTIPSQPSSTSVQTTQPNSAQSTNSSVSQFRNLNTDANLHSNSTVGQYQPPGIRPRVTTTMWEDEKTLCYQVDANNVSVVRRADNNMINGTKLLNVAQMTRGRRDGILKSEKVRHVVKIGSMHLKGVWIPFERALAMAQREGIVDLLYPLFVRDIKRVIQTGISPTKNFDDNPQPQPQPQPPQSQQQPQQLQLQQQPQQNQQQQPQNQQNQQNQPGQPPVPNGNYGYQQYYPNQYYYNGYGYNNQMYQYPYAVAKPKDEKDEKKE